VSGLRLAVYTDAVERGGAEASLAALIAELGDDVEVTVMGVTPEIVAWLAAVRPGAKTVVIPPVRDKRDLRPIAQHYRAIRAVRPQIFQANLRHPWSCQYGLAAALLVRHVAVIAVEHAAIPATGPLQRKLKRLTSARLAAHVCVGERAATEIAALAGLRDGSLKVIYSGVPETQGEPAPRPSGELVVGCLGRFSPEKGLDVLLRALPSLPFATAVLVGDGAERGHLDELAGRLGVRDRLVLTGWHDDPAPYLRALDVLVSPSRFEALPLAVLEAMRAGLPVVASDVGSVSEAVAHGETGLLVPPDDPAALAEALRTMHRDPARRRRMGERGRTVASVRFTPQATARAFEALYAEVLG
jgi:glycosyltransferase involved in cell wall biosynthesis